MPRAIALAGPVIRTDLAVDEHLALVGLDQPVEDVHERALAGAVLAEEGMDLAGPDVEVDVVVGEDAGELLGDAAHARAPGAPARGAVRARLGRRRATGRRSRSPASLLDHSR